MPTVYSQKFSRRLYLFATFAFFGLAAAISCWTTSGFGSSPGASARVATGPSDPIVPQDRRPASPAPDSMQVETLTLTPRGFQPTEIERPAGKFLLGIDNHIRPEEFSFEIVQDDGHTVRQLKLQKGELRLRKLLNLQAGRYVIREVNHPEWNCSFVLSR